MACKPMVVVSYEYPLSQEGAEHFLAQSQGWIKQALAAEGAVEFRTYRNVEATSPLVIALTVFDTVEHALASKPIVAALARDMRVYGASNIDVRIWASSPVYPDPIKP